MAYSICNAWTRLRSPKCLVGKQLQLLYSREFFPTARALICYFEVTWHLTNKLFPAKISECATLQNLWYQKVTVHRHWPLARFVFINLYMKEFFFVDYSPSSTLGNSEILGKQTVSLGTSHEVFIITITTIMDKNPWDSSAIFIFFCHSLVS